MSRIIPILETGQQSRGFLSASFGSLDGRQRVLALMPPSPWSVTATAVSPDVPVTLLRAECNFAAAHEAVHAPPRHPDVIRRRFPSSLEKYLGEVRLQRFGIGRLTTEADIAVGTDHIQTCIPSSITVV